RPTRMRRLYAKSLVIGLIPIVACAQTAPVSESAQPASSAPASTQPSSTPTLVVFFTVDQMRPDYFSRFDSQLTGGLARLYHGGAFYTNAFQDHAITETAPGHSATMSGRFPA